MADQQRNIYVSVAKADETFAEAIQKHLKPWVRTGEVTLATDAKIGVGTEARDQRVKAVNDADAVVFLVSADFFDDDEIFEYVLPRALERQKDHGIALLPVILRKCDLSKTALSGRVSLPRTGKPIEKPGNDEAWVAVVHELQDALKNARPPVPVEAPKVQNITEAQSIQLRDALVNAFTSAKNLRLMVDVEMHVRAQAIVGEETDAQATSLRLIQWAHQNGRLPDLLRGALSQRRASQELQTVVSSLARLPS